MHIVNLFVHGSAVKKDVAFLRAIFSMPIPRIPSYAAELYPLSPLVVMRSMSWCSDVNPPMIAASRILTHSVSPCP